jgi:hypothetical protein
LLSLSVSCYFRPCYAVICGGFAPDGAPV